MARALYFCEGAMEALLLEKTRNLEHQLTTTRLRLAEASGKILTYLLYSFTWIKTNLGAFSVQLSMEIVELSIIPLCQS